MATVNFLSGSRWPEEAYKIYRLPMDRLDKRPMLNRETGEVEEHVDFESEQMKRLIVGFINHHLEYQVPRLKELWRYYLADNNINYRQAKPDGRADNRIPSDYAKFDVTFKRGVIMGNDIQYTGATKTQKRIEEFSERVNENYHNQLVTVDMFVYGKAYEWLGRNEDGLESLYKLDTQKTFIIYDSSKRQNSICGVNYYSIEFDGEIFSYVDVYGNDGFFYQFVCENKDYDNLELKNGPEQTLFTTVQINEWYLNEERTSDFEPALPNIDAYDASRSELANFQQDMSEAMLVIEGNPDTFKDKDGKINKKSIQYSKENRIMIMGDRKAYEDGSYGTDPKAYYLVKEYDVTGTEATNDRTVADILRSLNLIDFTDENIGGNQSGVGFKWKGWGSDNDCKNKEQMISKALKRRLRLLAHSWSLKDRINKPEGIVEKIKSVLTSSEKEEQKLYDEINKIEIKFNRNVPQSEEELMKVITGMVGTVSNRTIAELSSRLTGVSVEEELKRLELENRPIPLTDEEKAKAAEEQAAFLAKQVELEDEED